MGLASAIFWIVFGILYVVYRAFKEEPEQTVSGVVVCVGMVGGITLWCFLFNALLEAYQTALAFLLIMVTFIPLMIWWIRMVQKKNAEDDKRHRDYERYLEILYDMDYSEEEFEKFLNKWRNGGSMAQIRYDLARDPEKIAEGRALAFRDFAITTGLSRKAWDQVKAEKEARGEE